MSPKHQTQTANTTTRTFTATILSAHEIYSLHVPANKGRRRVDQRASRAYVSAYIIAYVSAYVSEYSRNMLFVW